MANERKIWIGLTVLVILAIGTTFAWWLWQNTEEENTNVSLTVDGMTINYDAGPNIEGINLIPVSSKEKGKEDGTGIYKEISVTAPMTTYLNLYMTLETFPEELAEESMLYSIEKNDEVITSGNFSELKQKDKVKILDREVVDTVESVFKLYIWIDGNQANPTDMMNQSFSFVLSADGTTDPNPIASTYLMSINDGEGWEANSSGLFKISYNNEEGEEIAEDYRYVGTEANNFVSFNNDLYRIKGVFDENTHGKTGERLVKLIMENPLYAASYGSYNNALKDGVYSNHSNNWTGLNQTTPASGNVLLNQYFLNKTNISNTYGTCGNWTYYSNTNDNKTHDCTTLIGYGIDEELNNYIETTTWHLNGHSDTKIDKKSFYLCERGLYTGCSPVPSANASTEAKIGLMYPSDYIYATGSLGSNDTNEVYAINYGNQNWLYKGYEWTITPVFNNLTTVFCIAYNGTVGYGDGSAHGYIQRPTFYLKSNIKITGGEGTVENPYTISM